MSRQIKLYILLALLSLVMTSPAFAGGWIIGAKTGTMVVSDTSTLKVKTNPTNVGILVGYEQGIAIGDIALEGELTTTTSKGEYKSTAKKFNANTQAVYVAFRSAGPMFLTAKAGYLQTELADTLGQKAKTKSGGSYGIGFGIGFGLAQVELELAKAAVNPDITFINVGVVF